MKMFSVSFCVLFLFVNPLGCNVSPLVDTEKLFESGKKGGESAGLLPALGDPLPGCNPEVRVQARVAKELYSSYREAHRAGVVPEKELVGMYDRYRYEYEAYQRLFEIYCSEGAGEAGR